jgi:uncharacterized protein (TIGR02147 family)
MAIFNFSDYKRFLNDYIASQPKKGRGLVKAISEHLGVDPSAVSQVLSGDRDFTEEHAILVSQYVGMNEIEAEYFMTLVKIERAGSVTLKKHYQKKRDDLKTASLDLKSRVKQDRILTDTEKAVFYSSYLYSAIRMTSSIGEGTTAAEIAERFQIPREKAAKILNFLTETNLCKEEKGRIQVGTQHTHVEKNSPFVSRHHHNWRVQALQKTESLTDKELQFTGPVSISKEEFAVVREVLVEAINKSLARVKESDPSDVACLLIDWFWI